jgi:large subunit ribosomal protein L4
MELTVFNTEGAETGRKVLLSEEVFGLETPNEHAIYLDVKHILANQRQGTHKTKERAEVAASTRKLYRQKGTGNARAGSRKSPIRKSGGTIFGPRPRDYGARLNGKVKALARRSALTLKAREAGIMIVERFDFEAPKTRRVVELLDKLQIGARKVLVVMAQPMQNVYLSARNLPGADVRNALDLNTYDILHADTLLIMEDAVKLINDRFAN